MAGGGCNAASRDGWSLRAPIPTNRQPRNRRFVGNANQITTSPSRDRNDRSFYV